MNLEKVVFGFFILLALTLNFGFVYGEITNPAHHDAWELFVTIVVNLIATVLKFGERTQIGAILLASSLVADLQLAAAAILWGVAIYGTGVGLTEMTMASVVSLASGALVANVVSVTLLIIETVRIHR
ncbi:MAG: DUF6394 family protein [Halorhodospira sp.]